MFYSLFSRPLSPPGSNDATQPDSRAINGGHSKKDTYYNNNKNNNNNYNSAGSGSSRVSTSIHKDGTASQTLADQDAISGSGVGGVGGGGAGVDGRNPVGDTGMIVGVVIAVSVAVIVVVYAVVKYRNRDEGSYKIDESKNYGYVTASTGGGSGGKDGGGGDGGGSGGGCSGGGAGGGGGGGCSGGGKSHGNVKYSKDGTAKLPKKKDIKEWYV